MRFPVIFLSLFWLGNALPPNPCPRTFQYIQDDGNIYGQVLVPNDYSGTYELSINVSLPVITRQQNIEIQLITPQSKLNQGQNPVYRVVFPFQHVLPRITSITFNGKPYCYGPPEPVTPRGVTNLWATTTFITNALSNNNHNGYTHFLNYDNGFQTVPFTPPSFFHKPFNTPNSVPDQTFIYITNIFSGSSSDKPNKVATQFVTNSDKPFESRPAKPQQNIPAKPQQDVPTKPILNVADRPLDNKPIRPSENERPFDTKLESETPKPFVNKPPVLSQTTVKAPQEGERNEISPVPVALNTPSLTIAPYPCDPDFDERIDSDVECPNNQPVELQGTAVEKGQFPWLVAVFQRYNLQRITYLYRCTGNLISKNHVLSAGHCFFEILQNPQEEYVCIFGLQDISQWSQKATIRGVKKVQVHEFYTPETGENDFAILTLESPVEFSNVIKPIDLWSVSDGSSVVGKKGMVAGWGNHTAIAKKLDLTVTSAEKCLKSARLTFCAGGPGVAPCASDGGAGIAFQKNGEWQLRGIVTHAVQFDGKVICEANKDMAFADVKGFIPWIRETASN